MEAHTGVLDFIYPPVCPFCGEISYEGICSECKKKIIYIEDPKCIRCGKPLQDEKEELCRDCSKVKNNPIEAGRSLWVHKKPVSSAIYDFKYKNKRYYGKIFAREMVRKYKNLIYQWDIDEIVPVPVHNKRLKKRGYNQAAIIAEEVGKLMGIPVYEDMIIRIKNTKPQKKLNDEERIKNIKGAFVIKNEYKPGKNVLIIDDIYTTGTTIRQIAQIMKASGAEKLFFLTISIGQGI